MEAMSLSPGARTASKSALLERCPRRFRLEGCGSGSLAGTHLKHAAGGSESPFEIEEKASWSEAWRPSLVPGPANRATHAKASWVAQKRFEKPFRSPAENRGEELKISINQRTAIERHVSSTPMLCLSPLSDLLLQRGRKDFLVPPAEHLAVDLQNRPRGLFCSC